MSVNNQRVLHSRQVPKCKLCMQLHFYYWCRVTIKKRSSRAYTDKVWKIFIKSRRKSIGWVSNCAFFTCIIICVLNDRSGNDKKLSATENNIRDISRAICVINRLSDFVRGSWATRISPKYSVHSPLPFALAIGRTDSPPKFHSRPPSHRHFLWVICVPTRCCSIDCPAWQKRLLNSPAFFNFQSFKLSSTSWARISMSRGIFLYVFFSLFPFFTTQNHFTNDFVAFFIRQIDNIFFLFSLLYTFSSRTTFVLLAWISAWCGIIW